jgi:hypothetical protein
MSKWTIPQAQPPAIDRGRAVLQLTCDAAAPRPVADVLPELAGIVAEFKNSPKLKRLKSLYTELLEVDGELVQAMRRADELDALQKAAARDSQATLAEVQRDLAAANATFDETRARWEATRQAAEELAAEVAADLKAREQLTRLTIADKARSARRSIQAEIEAALSPLLSRLANETERWNRASEVTLPKMETFVTVPELHALPRLIEPAARQINMAAAGAAGFAGAR